MKSSPIIIMLGTALETQGGISAVVKVYRQNGLFERWPVVYVATHTDRGVWPKVRMAAAALVRYTALLVCKKVSLVHVHTASSASFWRKSVFMTLAFLRRCPVVLHVHGGGFIEFFEKECGPARKAFVRFLFDRSAQIVVLSQEWRSKIGAITKNANIVPIFNPVQADVLPRQERPDTHALLFLGKIHREKGVFDLLEAVARLRDTVPDIQLLCGGNGDLAEMKKRAEALGISDCVQFLGWVGEEEKQRLLTSASIYVLPSYYEGLPMSVLEAMAAGLPVVSTAIGGIPEAITDGVDGYLISPGDIPRLTVVLQSLLKDAELRSRMGAAGRKRVDEDFAASVILPQVEAVYRKLGGCALDPAWERETPQTDAQSI